MSVGSVGQVESLGEGDQATSSGMLIGFWETDRARGLITADAVFARLFGLAPHELSKGMDLQKVVNRLRPEDRARGIGILSGSALSLGDQARDVGVARPEGGWFWITLSARQGQGGQGSGLSGAAVCLSADLAEDRAFNSHDFRFRALAEALPQNVFSTDAAGVHDFLNRRWFEFTGHPYGPVTPEQWFDYLHRDDRRRTMTVWNECLASGTPYDIEYRYRRHDGQYRWMRVMALPERDAEGRIRRWFGTATDIHETKRLAEEREVVSAELGHRIKNLFSIFSGLISLSARADEGASDFAEAVQKRLTALALAHDFIALEAGDASPVQAVSLHGLIDLLASPYGAQDSQNLILCGGEDMQISKSAVTSITLIVHELLTNAVKYGALSSSQGQIRIDTHQAAPFLRLHWQEAWPKPLELGASGQGFGSRMLSTVVETMLHGRLERSLKAQGLDVYLDLPLDRMG